MPKERPSFKHQRFETARLIQRSSSRSLIFYKKIKFWGCCEARQSKLKNDANSMTPASAFLFFLVLLGHLNRCLFLHGVSTRAISLRRTLTARAHCCFIPLLLVNKPPLSSSSCNSFHLPPGRGFVQTPSRKLDQAGEERSELKLNSLARSTS